MEKDTLGKMIDLYVEKELETQTVEIAQSFYNLICRFEQSVGYGNYDSVMREVRLLKQQLAEKYNLKGTKE